MEYDKNESFVLKNSCSIQIEGKPKVYFQIQYLVRIHTMILLYLHQKKVNNNFCYTIVSVFVKTDAEKKIVNTVVRCLLFFFLHYYCVYYLFFLQQSLQQRHSFVCKYFHSIWKYQRTLHDFFRWKAKARW